MDRKSSMRIKKTQDDNKGRLPAVDPRTIAPTARIDEEALGFLSSNEKKMAEPCDWQTTPLPVKRTKIVLDRQFSTEEIQRMLAGLIPEAMEDKWFIYWHDDMLFFHRSWTGFCIYVVRFAADGDHYRVIDADVNRDPEQYPEVSVERDAKIISFLIDVVLLRRPGEFPSE